MINIPFDPDAYIKKLIETEIEQKYRYCGISEIALKWIKHSLALELLNDYYKISALEEIFELDLKLRDLIKKALTVNPLSTTRGGPLETNPLINPLIKPYITTPNILYDNTPVLDCSEKRYIQNAEFCPK